MKSLKCVLVLMVIWLAVAACSLPGWLVTDQNAGEEPETATITAPAETFMPTFTLTATAVDSSLEILNRTDFITSEGPRYEIELIWPNLAGAEFSVSSFNTEINGWVTTIKETFITDISSRTEQMNVDPEMPQSYLLVNYETPLHSQGLVSFYVRIERYYAMAAHPGHVSGAYNFDAIPGVFLSLGDLFHPDVDYLSRLTPLIDEELARRDFGYDPGTAEDVMQERENWNLLPDGLRFNFDEYEVGPYAAGPQSVLIPWDAIQDLINPDGPLGRLEFLP